MKNYLNSLIRKHRNLDAQIESAKHSGQYAAPQIREFKKMRLNLKDRIEQIRRTAQGRAAQQLT